MANAFRGEVTLTHDGQDYTMVLDFNALCEYEDITGDDWKSLFSKLEKGGLRATEMRALVCAGLRGHHPDITLSKAGSIISSNPDAVDRAAEAAAVQGGDVDTPGGDRGNGKAKRPGP